MTIQITFSKGKLFSGENIELKIRKYNVERQETTKLSDIQAISRGLFVRLFKRKKGWVLRP